MSDTKYRTPPSSDSQIYGRVHAKIFNTLFHKSTGCREKTAKYLPKYGENLHGKRYMCMHHILEKFRNPNFSLYHAQAKELDSQYSANLCKVIAPGMDYIWRHDAADIQMPDPLESKCNMDN